MGSTIRSLTSPSQPQYLSAGSLRWRNWPLVDHPRSSWIVPLAILLVGGFAYRYSGSLLFAGVACVALAATLWSFFLPNRFEVTSLGLRRRVFKRIRIIPWQAIHSYQLRSTGVMLYQRPDPIALDLSSSLFVPYPDDADELRVALRLYLPHAVELPE
jgi:hypothetical protein